MDHLTQIQYSDSGDRNSSSFDFARSEPHFQPQARPPIQGRRLLSASSVGTFARIEDKFLVPVALKEALVEAISPRLELSPFSGKKFSEIESIYYDSDSLVSFTDHFKVGTERFKLRTRRYGPDGVFQDAGFHLELKTKKADGVSRKFRFKLSGVDLTGLTEGVPLRLSPTILKLNPEVEIRTLVQRMRKVNDLVARFGLRPVAKVTYERLAYERGDLRVTMDRNVRYEPLAPLPFSEFMDAHPALRAGAFAMRERYGRADSILLEVKHAGILPEWLTQFLEIHSIQKESFSKYCFAIANISDQTSLRG